MKDYRVWQVFGLIVLLCGCSRDHQPAPVVDAGSYSSATKGVILASQYRVKPGETLYSIAWRADLNPKTLADINHIPSPYTIYPNQLLILHAEVVKKSGVDIKVIKSGGVEVPRTDVSKIVVNVNKLSPDVKKTLKEVETKPPNEYSKSTVSSQSPKIEGPVTSWKWPVQGKIIKGFSSSATGNKGVDIKGSQGQKVFATADGYVVYAGSGLRGYGKLIIIRHNEDYLSAYAHNSQLRVKEQQAIKAGQHIADMGDTGTTDTRLHFEIRYQGKSVDPMKYLPKL